MTTIGDRAGVIARIRQIRRPASGVDRPADGERAPERERLQALEMRVRHLEQIVEGLQDSVHRESERHAKLIAELQTQVEPGAMGASLADDARRRGL